MIFHAVTKLQQLSQSGEYSVRWELVDTPNGERWTATARNFGTVIGTFEQEEGLPAADSRARAACVLHHHRKRAVAA